jgi:RHS repeat-associated protein
MQLALPSPMPDASPAVFAVNDRKPRQGGRGQNPGLHQRFAACKSTTALGVSWGQWSGTVPGARVSYEYDAYGNEFTVSGSTPNEFMYRGEQFDSDLGLYYLRARYYNPLTGRFMSRDPNEPKLFDLSGIPTDPKYLHKYLYANGDPVNHVDSLGRAVPGEDEAEEGGLTEEIGELGEKLEEEKLPEAFANKFTDVDDAFEQLESLEDDQSYQDPGYNPSSKKSLDALINAAKKFFNP